MFGMVKWTQTETERQRQRDTETDKDRSLNHSVMDFQTIRED